MSMFYTFFTFIIDFVFFSIKSDFISAPNSYIPIFRFTVRSNIFIQTLLPVFLSFCHFGHFNIWIIRRNIH